MNSFTFKLNAEQGQLKVSLTQKTNALNTATNYGYTDGSGVIDAMMGMPGRNMPEFCGSESSLANAPGDQAAGPQKTPPHVMNNSCQTKAKIRR